MKNTGRKTVWETTAETYDPRWDGIEARWRLEARNAEELERREAMAEAFEDLVDAAIETED